jgi:predicted dehydrogenase
MNIPKLILIGIGQSGWKEWKYGPPIASFDPYGRGTEDVPFPLLKAVDFCPSLYDGAVFVASNDTKIPMDLVADAVISGLTCLVLKMRTAKHVDMTRLSELSAEQKGRLLVGDQYRYRAGAMAVMEAVRCGLAGRLEYASWHCALPMAEHFPWAESYAHLTLEDLAYHHLMTLSTAIGPLSGKLYASSFSPDWSPKGEKGYCTILGRMDDGLVLQYETRWGTVVKNGNFFGEWTLEGEKGLLWTDGDCAMFSDRAGNAVPLTVPAPRYVGWSGIVDHFCEWLMGIENSQAGTLMDYSRFEGILGLIRAGVASAEGNSAICFP